MNMIDVAVVKTLSDFVGVIALIFKGSLHVHRSTGVFTLFSPIPMISHCVSPKASRKSGKLEA